MHIGCEPLPWPYSSIVDSPDQKFCLRQIGCEGWKVETTRRENSLWLLPSGPDQIGEDAVRQPSTAYIGEKRVNGKG